MATELQTRILNGSNALSSLASAIDRLPDSETRGELIYKASKILERQAWLCAELEPGDCYFGFTDKCPGCHCADCEHYQLIMGTD